MSGLVTLFVAFQRRKQVGRQWAILASGTIAAIAGSEIRVVLAESVGFEPTMGVTP